MNFQGIKRHFANFQGIKRHFAKKGIKRHFANPGEQFQNGKGGKCIDDVWMMAKTALLCALMLHVFCGIRHGFMLVQ